MSENDENGEPQLSLQAWDLDFFACRFFWLASGMTSQHTFTKQCLRLYSSFVRFLIQGLWFMIIQSSFRKCEQHGLSLNIIWIYIYRYTHSVVYMYFVWEVWVGAFTNRHLVADFFFDAGLAFRCRPTCTPTSWNSEHRWQNGRTRHGEKRMNHPDSARAGKTDIGQAWYYQWPLQGNIPTKYALTMVQYLHFRILEFPLILCVLWLESEMCAWHDLSIPFDGGKWSISPLGFNVPYPSYIIPGRSNPLWQP